MIKSQAMANAKDTLKRMNCNWFGVTDTDFYVQPGSEECGDARVGAGEQPLTPLETPANINDENNKLRQVCLQCLVLRGLIDPDIIPKSYVAGT